MFRVDLHDKYANVRIVSETFPCSNLIFFLLEKSLKYSSFIIGDIPSARKNFQNFNRSHSIRTKVGSRNIIITRSTRTKFFEHALALFFFCFLYVQYMGTYRCVSLRMYLFFSFGEGIHHDFAFIVVCLLSWYAKA